MSHVIGQLEEKKSTEIFENYDIRDRGCFLFYTPQPRLMSPISNQINCLYFPEYFKIYYART